VHKPFKGRVLYMYGEVKADDMHTSLLLFIFWSIHGLSDLSSREAGTSGAQVVNSSIHVL